MRRLAMLVILSLCPTAFLQAQTVVKGTPPFGSFGNGPIDTIDLANLNVHLSIPVVSKPGRGVPFVYAFGYDSSVWSPSTAWLNDANWGWQGQVQVASGYVTYAITQLSCNIGTHTDPFYYYYNKYTFKNYLDMQGTTHPFWSAAVVYDDSTCSAYPNYPSLPYSKTISLVDGSGLSVYVDAGAHAIIYPPNGGSITPPVQNANAAPMTTTDFNGNQVTSTDGVNFRDTLGTTALAITGNAQSGTVTYTFQTTTGTNVVTVNYSAFTVKTVFACAGIGDITTPNVYLPVTISRPEGSYQIAYEQTPGYGSTYTTGRLAQITLPTGGTIQYSYNNGGLATGVAKSGIVCADGSTAGITRTLSPAAGVNEGTWVYSRGGSSPAWNTTVTDPAGNDTYIQFQGIYETQRDVHTGSKASGPILQTVYTCYNGASYPCNTTGITMPPTEQAVTTVVNGFYRQTDTTFDGYSNPLVTKEYDFGSGSRGALLRETDITYANISGGIVDRPNDIIVKDGSGNKVSETKYTYDNQAIVQTSGAPNHDYSNYPYTMAARGNITQVSRWVSGSTYLSTTNTYDDLGNLRTTTDPGGNQTAFTYTDNYSDATNHSTQALLTQITNPQTGSTSHILKMQYNWPTGLLSQSIDQNSQATSYIYDSALRPSSVTYPDAGKTFYSYPNAQQVELQHLLSGSSCSGANCSDAWAEIDGLGRPTRSARANGGEAGGAYDQFDVCYTPTQLKVFTSFAYQGSGLGAPNGGKQCVTGDTTSFDALGRPLSLVHSTDAAHPMTFSYNGRATKVQDGGNGSAQITRVFQHDGLARTVTTCEEANSVFASTTAGCGLDLDPAVNGVTTNYIYDPLGNVTQITQGALAARQFSYDGLSQMVGQIMPEISTKPCQPAGSSTYYSTCYYYNAAGNLYQKVRPSPNQSGSYITTTTYSFDALHRPTQVQYSDSNPSPAYVSPTITYVYDETSFSGLSLQNSTGRLTHVSAGNTTDVVSYDVMGRIKNDWQCTAYNCGTGFWNIQYGYGIDGSVTSSTNGQGVTFTYSYNQAQRLKQISSSLSDSNHPATLLSAAHYNQFGEVLSDSLGNGVAETAGFDARGRLQYASAVKGASTIYTINNASTPISYASNDSILGTNESANGNWTYTYDTLGRVATANKSGGTSLSYDVDRNSNRWHQNPVGSGGLYGSYNQATNQIASGNGVTYDAAGNIANDGLHAYVNDDEGRVVRVDNGQTATYVYDGYGRRVQRIFSIGTFNDLHDLAGHMVSEVNNTSWIASEIYAGPRHVGTYANGTTYFSHADWVGTERVHSTVTGTIDGICTSNPYGDLRSCSGADPTRMGYAGMEFDSESQLYHTLNRSYSPRIGSWITPDPIGLASANPTDPQSLNLFQYVENKPTVLTDQTGTCPLIIAGITESENSPAGQALIKLGQSIGANVVFPYDGQGVFGSLLSMFWQGLGFQNSGSKATTAALQASNDGSPVNVFSFSGGAQALISANQATVSSNSGFEIQGVDYLSPGFTPFGGGPLLHGKDPANGGFTNRWHENGFVDSLVNFTAADQTVANTPLGGDCGHSVACAINNNPKFDEQVGADLLQGTDPCDHPMVFSRKHKPHSIYPGGGGRDTSGIERIGLPFCQLIVLYNCSDEGCSPRYTFICYRGISIHAIPSYY